MRVGARIERQVFVVPFDHPISQGLDATDLRDWRGESTLVEPYPDYLNDDVPRGEYVGSPLHGWRWGGYGGVTSAPIEKPHRAGWTPIFECGFDLAYSPLMELAYGSGRVVLCTLDLEDHAAKDPAAAMLAKRLVAYASGELTKVPAFEAVDYVGGGDWRDTLRGLGVPLREVDSLQAAESPVIVDASSTTDASALRAWLRHGGRALIVGSNGSSSLGLPIDTAASPTTKVAPPGWSATRGLSSSDLRSRVDVATGLLRGDSADASGLFAKVVAGKGEAIFTRLDPAAFDTDAEPYLRYTQWRHSRALTQLVANMSVQLKMDKHIFQPRDSARDEVSLAGTWRVTWTQRMQPAPDYHANAHPDRGPSERALSALAESTDGSSVGASWRGVDLPGGMQQAWEDSDGEAVFTRRFNAPASWAGQELTLSLGPIDDFDDTWINGVHVGKTDDSVPSFYSHRRAYRVPAGVIRPGENVITVRVFDRFGGGGFAGQPADLIIQPAATPAGLYVPGYREDFAYGDDPYRYCRW